MVYMTHLCILYLWSIWPIYVFFIYGRVPFYKSSEQQETPKYRKFRLNGNFKPFSLKGGHKKREEKTKGGERKGIRKISPEMRYLLLNTNIILNFKFRESVHLGSGAGQTTTAI